MSPILYYLVIKPLSFLPYWVLYGISNVVYLIVFHLIGYRKKVVYQNLRNSFPDKTEKEIDQIARKFYRHFCDLIVESVKLFSVNKKTILKRMVVTNPEILDDYAQKGQSVIMVGGHYNNWEMLAVGIDMQLDHQTVGLYSKLKDDFFNKVMVSSRGRYGMRMVSTKNTSRYFEDESMDKTMTIFGADQSPTYSKNIFWTHFLNQETAVAVGTERYAKKYQYPVFFGSINKVKRGHYSLTLSLLADKPEECEEGFITAEHTRRLEQQIIQEPAYWLWTHKRWKRKRQPDEALLTV